MATYSGISLVSWLEWKDSERHMRQDTSHGHRREHCCCTSGTGQHITHRHTQTHTLECASQLFLSRYVDLQASFSHVWVFVWRAVGWRQRHGSCLLRFTTLNVLLLPTCRYTRANLVSRRKDFKNLLKGRFFLIFLIFKILIRFQKDICHYRDIYIYLKIIIKTTLWLNFEEHSCHLSLLTVSWWLVHPEPSMTTSTLRAMLQLLTLIVNRLANERNAVKSAAGLTQLLAACPLHPEAPLLMISSTMSSPGRRRDGWTEGLSS